MFIISRYVQVFCKKTKLYIFTDLFNDVYKTKPLDVLILKDYGYNVGFKLLRAYLRLR